MTLGRLKIGTGNVRVKGDNEFSIFLIKNDQYTISVSQFFLGLTVIWMKYEIVQKIT